MIRYVSPSALRVLGHAPEDLVGRAADELIAPEDLEPARAWFSEAQGEPLTYRVRHRDGGWRWIEGIVTDLRHEPAIGGILVNGRDVTERVAAEDRLSHIAYHDTLTGLPNRAAVSTHVEAALGRAQGTRTPVAVCYLDLDGFKVVNDCLGHSVGDDLLVAVVDRLRGAVRSDDLIARLGGDEFLVVLEGAEAPRDAVHHANRILAALSEPFVVDGRRLVVSASVGIAVADDGACEAARLLRDADLAMYRAKARGRNRWEIFDAHLARLARRRLDVEAGLREAIPGQLVLHYQPEVALPSLDVVGVEALVRWAHPQRGLLAPDEFIDVAEDTGLILGIGEWVMRTACRQAAEWRRRLGEGAPRMGVNVSARQLQDEGFVRLVEASLCEAGLAPDRLRLELTESILVDHGRTARVLHELKELGVELAIDDFGTGYSSLAYLHRLPVDTIKIDRSFLASVTETASRAPLVDATVALARTLELHVVAEGVETLDQLGLLERVGCGRAQGYLFGRPTAADELEAALLTAHAHAC